MIRSIPDGRMFLPSILVVQTPAEPQNGFLTALTIVGTAVGICVGLKQLTSK